MKHYRSLQSPSLTGYICPFGAQSISKNLIQIVGLPKRSLNVHTTRISEPCSRTCIAQVQATQNTLRTGVKRGELEQ